MYSVYQSGQFGSLPRSRVSCCPCAVEARCSACFRSPADAYVVWPATRPGTRVVTSCSSQPGLVRASEHAAGVVKHLGRIDAVRDEFVARRLDVGDNQVHPLGGAGCRHGDVLADDDPATGAP